MSVLATGDKVIRGRGEEQVRDRVAMHVGPLVHFTGRQLLLVFTSRLGLVRVGTRARMGIGPGLGLGLELGKG